MRYGYPIERLPKPLRLPTAWAIAGAVVGVVLGFALGLDTFALGITTLLGGATIGVVSAALGGQFQPDSGDSKELRETKMDSRAAEMEPAIHRESGDRFQALLSQQRGEGRTRQR